MLLHVNMVRFLHHIYVSRTIIQCADYIYVCALVNRADGKYRFFFNAMNSVHFCSITFKSNQMHYFYYLKLKTIYNISLVLSFK
jgi:hypothetical protein